MWMRDIPKYILDILTDMLPLIQETFIDCAKDYQAFVINGVDGREMETESFVKT